jgi:hypothetical protein
VGQPSARGPIGAQPSDGPAGGWIRVNAYVVKPVDFGDCMVAVRHLGGFWALVNEAPPATVTR